MLGALLATESVLAEEGEALRAERVASAISAPVWDSAPSIRSNDGVVSLAWEWTNGHPGAPRFELQQAPDPGFAETVVRYRGPDRSSVLSGLRDGDLYFRVRALASGTDDDEAAWSDTLHVEVRQIDHTTLFLLLGTGFIVAALTATMILIGHARTRKEEAA